MTNEKPNLHEDVAALAREASELWQEHITSCGVDSKGKAELMKLMEPTQRLFAEWASIMQHGTYAEFFNKTSAPGGKSGRETVADGEPKSEGSSSASPRAKTFRSPSDVGHVDLAELTDRVAELEEKLAKLEAGSSKTPNKSSRPPRS